MKRLFFCFGIALTLGFFSSCAQHDPDSPDTSGSAPYGADGANKTGIDTVATPQTNDANFPDMNSTGTDTSNRDAGNGRDTTTRRQ